MLARMTGKKKERDFRKKLREIHVCTPLVLATL